MMIALLALSIATAPPSEQRAVDVTGYQLFWAVHRHLAADREAPAELLDSLFATPGYRALQERERRRGRITLAMRLAFLPRLVAQRESLEAADSWVKTVVPHLRHAADNKAKLDAFVQSFTSSTTLRAADSIARRFLPPSVRPADGHPPISIILFARDGRGYPHLIVADAARLAALGDHTRFFAHEFHHYYRHTLSRESPSIPPGASALRAVLTNIEFEGIADRLDKSAVTELSEAAFRETYTDSAERAYLARYRHEFARGPAWIELLDSALAGMPNDSASYVRVASMLGSRLPDGGRVLGAYMSATITKAFGQDALADVAGDPKRFFALYSRAAAACGATCGLLSPRSLAVIESLYPNPG